MKQMGIKVINFQIDDKSVNPFLIVLPYQSVLKYSKNGSLPSFILIPPKEATWKE